MLVEDGKETLTKYMFTNLFKVSLLKQHISYVEVG